MKRLIFIALLLTSYVAEAQLIGAGRRGVSGSGGITNEVDPVFIAHPSAGITSQVIANWNAAATATTNGSFVPATGNSTVAGTKIFQNSPNFTTGLITSNITRGSATLPLNIQQTGTGTTIAQFDGTTGGLKLQPPGTAPTSNSNQLEVTGPTLLNGLTTTQALLPTANATHDVGSSTLRYSTFWGVNFLNSSIASFGTTNTGSSILLRQGNANQIVGGYFATSGNAYDQAPGLPPADNGYRRTIYGSSLTTGRADFTANWSDYQANFGANGQGGRVSFTNGLGGLGLVIGFSSLNSTIAQVRASNTLELLTSGTSRLSIDNTGLTSILGASTHAGTASFTDTYANTQANFGSNGQGGSISLSRGDNGNPALRIRTLAAGSANFEIATLTNLNVTGSSLALQASNSTLGIFSVATGGSTPRFTISPTGQPNFQNVPTYADNAAATTGGLAAGDVYRTATGQLMIRY